MESGGFGSRLDRELSGDVSANWWSLPRGEFEELEEAVDLANRAVRAEAKVTGKPYRFYTLVERIGDTREIFESAEEFLEGMIANTEAVIARAHASKKHNLAGKLEVLKEKHRRRLAAMERD